MGLARAGAIPITRNIPLDGRHDGCENALDDLDDQKCLGIVVS